jgi:hypothetical protein
VSTRCNEWLTFDIPPYSTVAAKCALSHRGVVMAQGDSEVADTHARDDTTDLVTVETRLDRCGRRATC